MPVVPKIRHQPEMSADSHKFMGMLRNLLAVELHAPDLVVYTYSTLRIAENVDMNKVVGILARTIIDGIRGETEPDKGLLIKFSPSECINGRLAFQMAWMSVDSFPDNTFIKFC